MRPIHIYYDGGTNPETDKPFGFYVQQGDRYVDQLKFEEMLCIVVRLVTTQMPDILSRFDRWMLTAEQHAEIDRQLQSYDEVIFEDPDNTDNDEMEEH